MINQQPNATEITGNMSPNFWKFNNASPNGVFGNKVYGDDLKRIWEFVAMVVVHGGESGGDMVQDIWVEEEENMKKMVMMKKIDDLNNEKDEKKWQSMVLEMRIKEIVCSNREIPTRV
ncbi:hypothetical protein Tco_0960494 [Tanacetum coccineum]